MWVFSPHDDDQWPLDRSRAALRENSSQAGGVHRLRGKLRGSSGGSAGMGPCPAERSRAEPSRRCGAPGAAAGSAGGAPGGPGGAARPLPSRSPPGDGRRPAERGSAVPERVRRGLRTCRAEPPPRGAAGTARRAPHGLLRCRRTPSSRDTRLGSLGASPGSASAPAPGCLLPVKPVRSPNTDPSSQASTKNVEGYSEI
ncbi:ATP-dependent RNA helicase RhlB-like isoform X2 [Vidua chalybeata]|uniref:ATP-dependent RNA helicase RhlB-like isoform X2 n=1 Tax=Vidua chalybeata TaxID=81927 RepID=UPI0023A80B68|nr:ATP-dependent RNA helicase RhlB-like isoform X2 [Vidua chalybeata]XP_053807295.1 ATP-dependent RNA helicase RhlB-like isoform X2 [Vidua chalybeata]XP_053807303.1 ATP-dependent RNA helicase RhlB-like isoform X2 [Vidua chalybeata]